MSLILRPILWVKLILVRVVWRKRHVRFRFRDYVESQSTFRVVPPSLDDPLSRLANRFGSDKGTSVPVGREEDEGPRLFFTPIYDLFLSEARHESVRILEIGIGSGSSLQMWSEYFPNASIKAIDLQAYGASGLDRVETFRIDQTDRVALRRFAEEHGPFDVIIDDGGHMMRHQQVSLGVLFPYLSPGGLYFIEDLHTSFWPFGKYRDLYGQPLDINDDRSNTTMRFLEDLVQTGMASSDFLSDDENSFLTRDTSNCLIMQLPNTEYGPNRLALLKKRSDAKAFDG